MNNKTLLVILVLSLTANLLVAGAVLGHFLKGGPEPRFPQHLGRTLQEVSPERHEMLRQRFREYRVESREMHRDLREQRRTLVQQVLSEPFDETAARQQFRELREQTLSLQAYMHEQMITTMKDLNREERAVLLRRLMRPEARRSGPG